ncbi:hypothetical protein EYS42_16810 [Aquabacterium lacunae]|uniref:Uncharacterized protein n=1 Tax=Aquabacterium lacunae TaxID=2528630 RepID=A0A4Q9GV85_9BURK|nr:hypothetical protein EYS42_16810 [Aquabacterium lacunae]
MPAQFELHIVAPGPRPAYYKVAEHLWGTGCDFDSDGDSAQPDDPSWTELTVTLRGQSSERVDIDPVSLQPLVLKVRAAHVALCRRAAAFVASYAGGSVVDPPNPSFKRTPDGAA